MWDHRNSLSQNFKNNLRVSLLLLLLLQLGNQQCGIMSEEREGQKD